ncbi:hypothetical protein BJ928_13011 [Rhizobium sp. WW_1]|nr:hypothetical protein BJ928_13011 [Rhizobium sp. WW_1]
MTMNVEYRNESFQVRVGALTLAHDAHRTLLQL